METIEKLPELHAGDILHVDCLGISVQVSGGYEITGRGYARLYGWELPSMVPLCFGDTRTYRLAGL